jgi:hypothetical protein
MSVHARPPSRRRLHPPSLSDPEGRGRGKAADSDEGSSFRKAEMTSQRAVVALAKHLRTQAAAGGDAEAVYLTLSATIQESKMYQEHPALPSRRAGRVDDGVAEPVEELAECCCLAPDEGLEVRVGREFRCEALPVHKRGRATLKKGVLGCHRAGGNGAAILPVPRCSSAPASGMNIRGPGGERSAPLPSGGSGVIMVMSPPLDVGEHWLLHCHRREPGCCPTLAGAD